MLSYNDNKTMKYHTSIEKNWLYYILKNGLYNIDFLFIWRTKTNQCTTIVGLNDTKCIYFEIMLLIFITCSWMKWLIILKIIILFDQCFSFFILKFYFSCHFIRVGIISKNQHLNFIKNTNIKWLDTRISSFFDNKKTATNKSICGVFN